MFDAVNHHEGPG